MRTIYKYPFKIDDKVEIEMPVGAKILHVEDQQGVACIWAMVHLKGDNKREMRHFRIFGTGHPLPEGFSLGSYHVGTFFQREGALVWHMFEVA